MGQQGRLAAGLEPRNSGVLCGPCSQEALCELIQTLTPLTVRNTELYSRWLWISPTVTFPYFIPAPEIPDTCFRSHLNQLNQRPIFKRDVPSVSAAFQVSWLYQEGGHHRKGDIMAAHGGVPPASSSFPPRSNTQIHPCLLPLFTFRPRKISSHRSRRDLCTYSSPLRVGVHPKEILMTAAKKIQYCPITYREGVCAEEEFLQLR